MRTSSCEEARRPPDARSSAAPSWRRRTWCAIALGALALGCGQKRELREWTPEDHAQPESVTGQVAPGNAMSDAERVALLWVEECASCHGEGGRGDGPSRPANAEVRDLTAGDWQGTVTDEQIAEIIRNGRGQMPAYDRRINDIGIAALVEHIRGLGGS